MDLFLFQLIVIFVPGIIWERIDAQYGRERATQQWDILRRTFVFGLVAYLMTFGLFWCVSLKFDTWAFQLFDFKKDAAFLDARAFHQISTASVVALICAIAWLYASNYKWITRTLQTIKATRRYGDEDVWELTFNSGRAEIEYLHLRDFDKKLTYAGWVEAWSESDRQREVVLSNVIVYDFEGNALFETPRVYLARKMDNIDIEFPLVIPAAAGEQDGATRQI